MKNLIVCVLSLTSVLTLASTVRADDLNEEVERIKVAATLGGMAGEDQTLRLSALSLLQRGFKLTDVLAHGELRRFALESEAKNVTQLRKIFQQFGWIGINKYGAQASDNAWLICQHADHDLNFQQECLTLMQRGVENGEANISNMAFLLDRIQVNKNEPQRYGTQGACVDGKWQMSTAEDLGKLDERRKTVGLGPISAYNAEVTLLCK